MVLLANHRLTVGVTPASQSLSDEADEGEEAIWVSVSSFQKE